MKKSYLLCLIALLLFCVVFSVVSCSGESGNEQTGTDSDVTVENGSEGAPDGAETDPGTTANTDTETKGTSEGNQTDAPNGDETDAPTDDGTQSTDVETVPQATKTDPVITLSSTDDITVKVGESVKLPDVSVKDYDGRDISAWLEISDSYENNTISDDTFTARVAGNHTVYYFVETADGRVGEAFLTVHVQGASVSTFDVDGYNDVTNMASYKEFREDFEKGKKSPLLQNLGNSSNASFLSGEEKYAIEGNSFVVDFSKGVTFRAFMDYYVREKNTTYSVTFTYRVIEGKIDIGNCYFGLQWDARYGLNRLFLDPDTQYGETYTVTVSFPSVNIPKDADVYFSMFYNASGNAPVIAIDNVIVKTVELEVLTAHTATQDELKKGYSWTFEKGAYANVAGGERVAVDSLPDDVKSEIQNSGLFGSHVMKATQADGHMFDGLNKNSFKPGMVLTLDMDYYAVNDDRFYLIMMGTAGNPTQKVTRTADGHIVHIHLETVCEEGWYALNIYGQSNGRFEIYIAGISVKLSNREDDGKTPHGFSVGDTMTNSTRKWGNTEKDGWTLTDYDGYDFGDYADKMGNSPIKLVFDHTHEVTMEYFQFNGFMETGNTYRITLTYYVDNFDNGDCVMRYNFDNRDFPFIGEGAYMSPGYHESTIEWVATHTTDFCSFYIDSNCDYNGLVYVKDIVVELVEIAAS